MKAIRALTLASIFFGSNMALADTYAVDPVHSSAIFRVRHMNTSWVYGRINNPRGTVSYDRAAPEKASFEVTLKAADIDTNVADRDKHLKSPEFFNAKEHPTLNFKSTAVKKTDDTHLEVTGDLTIHGVKKSVTVPIEISGTGKDMKGTPIIGFETTLNIKRSDFGMKELLNLVGDDVRIIVSLEAGKKGSFSTADDKAPAKVSEMETSKPEKSSPARQEGEPADRQRADRPPVAEISLNV
jgi:polyisoprenoid-binding protein YceI